jgi:hypothetical protein
MAIPGPFAGSASPKPARVGLFDPRPETFLDDGMSWLCSEMFGVDASRISAGLPDGKTGGNFSFEQFERETVGADVRMKHRAIL